ncbi:MAG: hypothetical protein LJF04_02425 [Gemmatimonadetes bacterium]|nr:hypothetical protein [Gemmatimonadota bacterium]
MKRREFEHAIRAAGAVLGVDEVLVIGSQALHGSVKRSLPEEAERSVEVDVAVLGDSDGRQADLLDGSIGEASMFHATFGYYAQGVVPGTAIVPEGWRQRLVPFRSRATAGVTALCLEPHDLWISKMIAGRPKDLEFGRALMDRGLVDADTLRDRLGAVEKLPARTRKRILGKIDAWSRGR